MRRSGALFILVIVLAAAFSAVVPATRWPQKAFNKIANWWHPVAPSAIAKVGSTTTVEIDENGLRLLSIGTAQQRDFRQEVRDVGVIDFNPDMSVAVFPSYQGKIIQAFVDLGQTVAKDQTLFTIYSPDLLQAEATLIQTAGVLDLTTKNLARLRLSVKNGGGAQKDLDQAQSDHQTAVGAYNSARLALANYGKSTGDADHIVASRTVDPVLAVKSPIAGTITARNAAPGLLVQPGTAPAPYTVADLETVRMYGFVSEDESPAIRLGQEMASLVDAYPDRVFRGRVTAVAPSVDANTHRVRVESEISDPRHLLRPNMFSEVVIRTGAPVRNVAVPADAVVRLGDGKMTVWTTADERHFTQRIVKIGLRQDGFDQVFDGVNSGEKIVTKGAVFVSNIANANLSP